MINYKESYHKLRKEYDEVKYMHDKLEAQNFDLIYQRNDWKDQFENMKRKYRSMKSDRNRWKKKYESMQLLMKDGGC